jgi:hypothetical protein
MAECKPKEKSFEDADLTSITNILKILLAAFKLIGKPARKIPPPLLLLGKNLRPGMSARNLSARIISRYESDAGVPMGDIFADGPNTEALKVRIMSEEMVKMLQTEAISQVSIDPGAIKSSVSGFAGPVPVAGVATSVLPVTGSGGLV